MAIPCINKFAVSVAVTGYPLGFLSAITLEGICHSILALVKCDITDIEEDVLARLSNLHTLALDFNKLTHIRQNWFSGLNGLYVLSLSNNKIERVDAGSFIDLRSLEVLSLQYNPLQTVDPDWFSGLQNLLELRLGSNHIPRGAFRYLHDLRDLTLGGNFTFVDGETFWGLRNLSSVLHVVGKRLGTVRDTVVDDASWSLSLHNLKDERDHHHIRRQDVSLTISDYLVCITHDPFMNEQTWGWTYMYNLSTSSDSSVTIENTSCGLPDILLTKTKGQEHSLVLIKTGFFNRSTLHSDTDQCRQGWEQNGGLTVALQGGLRLRFTTLSEANETMTAFALRLERTTHNASTNSSSTEENLKSFTHSNARNITCFVLDNGNTRWLVLNGHNEDQMGYNKTSPASTSTTPLEVSTIMNRPAPDDISIYAAFLTVPGLVLVLVSIVVILKRWLTLGNKNDRACIVPHAKSGRARSASLPAIPHQHSDVPHRQLVSCRSLPTTLSSIEPNYCEIPDDTALSFHAYCEIKDGGMSDVNRSALTKLPAKTRTWREEREDVVSCQSLPAVSPSTEPTYCNISDSDEGDGASLPFYGIAVDLTLPAVMGEGENRSIYHGNKTKRSRHLSLRRTRYDRWKSHRVTFYGKAAETSRDHGSLERSSRRLQQTSSRPTAVYGGSNCKSHRVTFYGKAAETYREHGSLGRISRRLQQTSSRPTAVYERSKSHGTTFYGKAAETSCEHGSLGRFSRRLQQTSSRPTAVYERSKSHRRVTFYGKAVNVPQNLSMRTNTKPPGSNSQLTQTQEDACSMIWRPTSWPCQIVEGGGRRRNQQRPASLTEGLNSAMGLQREDYENAPRQTSLAFTTPQTTYLRSGQLLNSRSLRSQSTRLSLPSLPRINGTPQNEEILNQTRTNPYRSWEIPHNAHFNTSRSEPQISTLANTYWPWEITIGSPLAPSSNRAFLTACHETLPSEAPSQINTYWPWEIPSVRHFTCGSFPVSVVVSPSVWSFPRQCGSFPVSVEVSPSVWSFPRQCGCFPVSVVVSRQCGSFPVSVVVSPSVWKFPGQCGSFPVSVVVSPSVWLFPRQCGRFPVSVVVSPSVWKFPGQCGSFPVSVVVSPSVWLFPRQCGRFPVSVEVSPSVWLFPRQCRCFPVSVDVSPSVWSFPRQCGSFPVSLVVSPSVWSFPRQCGGFPVSVDVSPVVVSPSVWSFPRQFGRFPVSVVVSQSVWSFPRQCGGFPRRCFAVSVVVSPSVWKFPGQCGRFPVSVVVSPSVWSFPSQCGRFPVSLVVSPSVWSFPVSVVVSPSVWRFPRQCRCFPVSVDVSPSVWSFPSQCGRFPVSVVVSPSVWSFPSQCGRFPVSVVVSQSVWSFPRQCGRFPVSVVVSPSVWRFPRQCRCFPVSVDVSPSVWSFPRQCGSFPVSVVVSPSVWSFPRQCGRFPVSLVVSPSVWRFPRQCGSFPVSVVVSPSVWSFPRQCGRFPVSVVVSRQCGRFPVSVDVSPSM
ncbi:hypothetical protein Bbelb_144870 [Branchiostoma belcheri]|nr:hypothetical protein Bbelb_144870 [Branchiostoma belcheri]